VHAHFQSVDVAILSAAVADYKPKHVATSKIKKAETTLSLELEKTKDILASLGKIKSHQILVGFALETNDEVDNAIKKLKFKNLNPFQEFVLKATSTKIISLNFPSWTLLDVYMMSVECQLIKITIGCVEINSKSCIFYTSYSSFKILNSFQEFVLRVTSTKIISLNFLK